MSEDKGTSAEDDSAPVPADEPTPRRNLGAILSGLAAGAVLGSAVAVPLAAPVANTPPAGDAVEVVESTPRLAPTAQEVAASFSERFRTAFTREVVADVPLDDPSVIKGPGCTPGSPDCSSAPYAADDDAASQE